MKSANIVLLQVCPSLLVKKDRGRPVDPKARPKAYGEVNVATDVPGVELLQTIDDDDKQEGDDSDNDICSGSDNDEDNDQMTIASGDEENQLFSDDTGNGDDEADGDDVGLEDVDDDIEDEENELEDNEEVDEEDGEGIEHEEDDDLHTSSDDDLQTSSDDESMDRKSKTRDSSTKKRKFADFDAQIIAVDTSLRALKKLAGATAGHAQSESTDGILSNEDFQRIKELKVVDFFFFFWDQLIICSS